MFIKRMAASLSLLVLGTVAYAGASDPYSDQMALADTEAKRGRFEEARRILVILARDYPQDYAASLLLGHIEARRRNPSGAESAYREALRRAPGSEEARQGLVQTLTAEGRCDDARALLPHATRLDGPAEAAVRECFGAEKARRSLSLGASWNQYWFPNHPIKSAAYGVLVTASGSVRQYYFGAGYRYIAIDTTGRYDVPRFAQNEAYAHVGWESERVGLTGLGGLLVDGSGALGTSGHGGVRLRYSPMGHIVLDALVSAYPDQIIGRAALSWEVPVVGPLSLTPGLAVQLAAGTPHLMPSLGARLKFARGGAWIGGKYGSEWRPAYLSEYAVYNITERISFGAWAGGEWKATEWLSIRGTYALDRLRRVDGLSPRESTMHSLSLGPTLTF